MAFSARIREMPEPSRQSLAGEAEPWPALGSLHYVIIHHLSPGRGRVEAYHGLRVGGQVEFDIPGLGRTAADVVSRTGDLYECAFRLPFEREAIRAKKLSAKVVWADFRRRTLAPTVTPTVTLRDLLVADDVKRFSALTRIAVIGGAATFLWGAIAAALW